MPRCAYDTLPLAKSVWLWEIQKCMSLVNHCGVDSVYSEFKYSDEVLEFAGSEGEWMGLIEISLLIKQLCSSFET